MTLNCKKCGKELKDKESKKRGYGPQCWESIFKDKVQLDYMVNATGFASGYQDNSDVICVNKAEVYDTNFVIFVGVSNPFDWYVELDFLLLAKKELVKADFSEIRYAPHTNIMAAVEKKYVPVMRQIGLDDYDDKDKPRDIAVSYEGESNQFNEIVYKPKWDKLELEGSKKRIEDLLNYDFKHSKFDEFDIHHPDINLFYDDEFHEKLMDWGHDWLREMEYERTTEYQECLKKTHDGRWGNLELPVTVAFEEASAYHPNWDIYATWWPIVSDKDFHYDDLPYVWQQALGRVIEEISDMIAHIEIQADADDYLEDVWGDVHCDHIRHTANREAQHFARVDTDMI